VDPQRPRTEVLALGARPWSRSRGWSKGLGYEVRALVRGLGLKSLLRGTLDSAQKSQVKPILRRQEERSWANGPKTEGITWEL
jgi:hypothetical protein